MFQFKDRNKLIQLIYKSTSEDHMEFQIHSLNRVVSYCMSSICRRKLILEYFDDQFDVNCNESCDNCLTTPPLPKDYTMETINTWLCLKEMLTVNSKINVKQLVFTFKGSKSKRNIESKGFHLIPHYGIRKNALKNDADSIKFVQNIINEVLMENLRAVDDRFTTTFITLGKKANLVRNREIQMFLRL